MTPVEAVKRYSYMAFGLFIMGLGVALCVNADLGTSPITTLAYTMHHIVPSLSLGTFVFLQNLVFFLLTVLFLGKNFRPRHLLQIPCSLFYGVVIDFWEWLIRDWLPTVYWLQFLFLLGGILAMGLGFSLVFTSGVPLEANTAFLSAVTQRTGASYGKLKIGNDVVIVLLAMALSLIFLHRVVGVREGTVIAAVLIGLVAGFFNRRLKNAERFFKPEHKMPTP